MNTYIFNCESDYFGITSSNYVYEIEVKISRADFKADAKKRNKHNAIIRTLEGKKMITCRSYSFYKYDATDRRFNREKGCMAEITYRSEQYTQGDFKKEHIDKNPQWYYSTVWIRKVPMVPNRFFYCVPKGMIKVHEVPHYAGLITIENNCIEIVKQAPFIHKNKLDLTKILLDKFYFRSLKLERNQTELF